MIQVFVSYSHKDIEFADQLATNLRDRDYLVWMDRSSIRGGELWRQSIIQGIKNSVVVCVVVSQNALESSGVLDEIKIALASSKTILPIIADSSSDFAAMLEDLGLENNQAIDFISLGFDSAFQRLLDALDYWTFPERVAEGLSHYNRHIRLKTVDALSKHPTAFGNQLVKYIGECSSW